MKTRLLTAALPVAVAALLSGCAGSGTMEVTDAHPSSTGASMGSTAMAPTDASGAGATMDDAGGAMGAEPMMDQGTMDQGTMDQGTGMAQPGGVESAPLPG